MNFEETQTPAYWVNQYILETPRLEKKIIEYTAALKRAKLKFRFNQVAVHEKNITFLKGQIKINKQFIKKHS